MKETYEFIPSNNYNVSNTFSQYNDTNESYESSDEYFWGDSTTILGMI